jgi:F-type H+-transporting ATPase subunit gamma
MPSLKDLKNRIGSVKSTRKITKAMQMVAAAKLRRAQEAAEAARPYAERYNKVLGGPRAVGRRQRDTAPRLLAGTGSDQTHLLVVMTSERGLCGGFNSTIVRLVRQRIERCARQGKTVKILTVGKKGREQLKRDYSDLFVGHVEPRRRQAARLCRCRRASRRTCSAASTRASSTSRRSSTTASSR